MAAEGLTVRRARPELDEGNLSGPRRHLPTILLLLAVGLSGTLLLALISKLTFLIDDWDFLLHRRGLSVEVFLKPHAEHISIIPVAIYKAIQAGIGMESLAPYGVVSTSAFLLSAVLLFAYLRRRCGGWLALAGTLPILFLGSASEDLLTPFQIGYFGSMACGLGVLLALDRPGGHADLLACALSVLSLCFSSLGLAFLAGAAVNVALRHDRLSRAWMIAVPALFYAAWWLGWGHTAPSQFSFANVTTTFSYVFDGFSSSISSLLGLATPRDDMEISPLGWGRPLLLALLLLAGLRLRQIRSAPRQLWIVAAIALTFWVLASANSSLGRAVTVGRYQYVGAIFILLIAAELVPRRGVGRLTLIVVFGLVGACVLSNLAFLRQQYHQFRNATEIVRGGLTGLEMAADRVPSGFLLTGENSNFNYFTLVDAGSYLSASAKFGSPAYTRDEIVTAPEPARVAADKVLAAALGIRLSPTSATPPVRFCQTLGASPSRPSTSLLRPGKFSLSTLSTSGPVEVFLSRFADELSVDLGAIGARSTSMLTIPPDRTEDPWQLSVQGLGSARICSSG